MLYVFVNLTLKIFSPVFRVRGPARLVRIASAFSAPAQSRCCRRLITPGCAPWPAGPATTFGVPPQRRLPDPYGRCRRQAESLPAEAATPARRGCQNSVARPQTKRHASNQSCLWSARPEGSRYPGSPARSRRPRTPTPPLRRHSRPLAALQRRAAGIQCNRRHRHRCAGHTHRCRNILNTSAIGFSRIDSTLGWTE